MLPVVLAFVLATALASPARASGPALTRERIAELVLAAPGARVAAAEAAVARAAVPAARVLSLDDPILSGLGGLRLNPDGSRPLAAAASLAWPIDLGGKRSARVGAAMAEADAAAARADDARRRFLLEALLQHARVLWGDRQLAIASARRAVAERLQAAAQKRRLAGSVPEIDVALSGLQLAQARSAEHAARGTRDGDAAVLRAMLGGAADGLAVAGPLVPEGEVPPLDTLLRELGRQTPVRAALASAQASREKAELERAERWPTIQILAQYEHDDRAHVGLLGLSVPIPVLNANRAGVATSAAEVTAADARLRAALAAAEGQVRALHARYEATKRARDALAPSVALATQATELAARGYELGEGDLASVLLVRREAIDAQSALLEAELSHASAKIELLVATGRMPR